MMTGVMSSLEPELQAFLTSIDRTDPYYCLIVLVLVSQHVSALNETGSYFRIPLWGSLVMAKRNFDKFMQTQVRAVEDTKVSKKNKCGIIPFVANFVSFAEQAEQIFKNSDRRSDLEKWYVQLVRIMYTTISRIATEHGKTPYEVIMLENFHNMWQTLSRLKIACLENEKKEARAKYQDQMKAYVKAYLGRPLEKLNNFFEGVQAKVAQGVKEDEVGYQLAYSKQELRKVTREYPGKEVKKGLESLYRKVEKHLCEEENLLQVVWREMQQEFLSQYKHFEGLIDRCYPGTDVRLEFGVDDILQFFSEIAQSH